MISSWYKWVIHTKSEAFLDMLTVLQLMQKYQNNCLSKQQGMKTEKTDTNYYS